MPLLYKKKIIKDWMDSNIVNITPRSSSSDIVSKIPRKILDTINQDVTKDLKELLNTYQCQLWTATALMTGRILENVLKIHITYDLKEKSVNDIGDAINILEKNKYNQNLIKKLRALNEKRNTFMHGNKRAGSHEAKELLVDVIDIVINVHNIKP